MYQKPKYNKQIARSTQGILQARDFLSSVIADTKKVEELRENNFIILIGGTHGAGKTKLADSLYTHLSGSYPILSTRASKDADGVLRDNKRRLLKRQEAKRAKWHDVVNALRTEAASALENKVLPFMQERLKNRQRGIIILNRYPFVDTLTKQYIRGIPPQGVAQKLRGEQIRRDTADYEPAGYLLPNLVVVMTCEPKEGLHRVITREAHIRTERSVALGPDYLELYKMELEAYKLMSDYDPATKKCGGQAKAFPGDTHLFDTSIPDLNYQENPNAAQEKIRRRAEEITDEIIKNHILPSLEKRQPNGIKKAGNS